MRERNVGGPLSWWKAPLPDTISTDLEEELRRRLAAMGDDYAERLVGSHAIWLPLPPSSNHAYKSIVVQVGQRVFCRRADTDEKKSWVEAAHRAMNAAAFPNIGQPTKRHFAVQMVVALASWRRDINNSTKLALDVIAPRLGLDDRYSVSELTQRLPVATKDQEGVLVRVNVFS